MTEFTSIKSIYSITAILYALLFVLLAVVAHVALTHVVTFTFVSDTLLPIACLSFVAYWMLVSKLIQNKWIRLFSYIALSILAFCFYEFSAFKNTLPRSWVSVLLVIGCVLSVLFDSLLQSIRANPKQYYLAVTDVALAFKRSELWLRFAWMDIKLRYRGSVLGPFWISFSMLIFISALGFVYSSLFHQPTKTYIPFLTTGFLVWMFMSACLMECGDVFLQSRGFILQINMPLMTYVLRMTWKNVLIFLHNAVVFIVVALFFRVALHWSSLLAIPALLLLFVNILWACLLLGIFGTRFRDIPPIVSSLMQVAFFITPVTWMPNLVSGKAALVVSCNPLSYFLDLVRQPLLGQVASLNTWIVCLSLTILGWLLTLIVFARARRRVPFWL